MLQEWKAMEKPEEEEIRVRLAAAKEKLAKQQLLIKEQKIPVLVLMEGWGTAGKGSVIGQVIQNIDPRFFKVESMGEKSEEERAIPMMHELSHLPIIMDPSHAAGMSRMVRPLSLASVGGGADGLMIEVHNDPSKALCDGPQALRPDQFTSLMKEVFALRKALVECTK